MITLWDVTIKRVRKNIWEKLSLHICQYYSGTPLCPRLKDVEEAVTDTNVRGIRQAVFRSLQTSKNFTRFPITSNL
jgi:hypothetical protein